MRNIFFTVGTGRSGTNFCHGMLNLHPDVKAVTETHFLRTLVRKFGVSRIRFDQFFEIIDNHYTSDGAKKWIHFHLGNKNTTSFYEDFRSFCASLQDGTVRDFTEKFFDYCYGQGNYLVGDKTPLYGLEMKALLDLWPQAKFIHVVRDGRFAAMSMQKHEGFVRIINAGFPHKVTEYSYGAVQKDYSTQPVSLSQCIDFWQCILNLIREESTRIPSKAYLEVRYEDLVLHPVRELYKIARFLKIFPNPFWFRRAIMRPQKTSLHGRNPLPLDQYNLLTQQVKPTLELYGYPTDPVS